MNTGHRELLQNNAVGNDAHVSLDDNGAWIVSRGERCSHIVGRYRRKVHAMAFARAVAYSRRGEMIVHCLNARPVRHSTETLTYPIHLD